MVRHTAAGTAEVELAPVSRAEWDARVYKERQRQIAIGYDAAHDREHGADHLMHWALTYLYRGERLKAAAMMEALRDLLAASDRPPVVVNIHAGPGPQASVTPPPPPAAGAASLAETVSPSICVEIGNHHATDSRIPHHLLSRRGRLVSSHLWRDTREGEERVSAALKPSHVPSRGNGAARRGGG